ncbi:NADPH:quinone oxidoreductase family protein [Parerythrobacter jejuensis]|uniref:Zinc-binding dehydrogenase n=1 Tax=Parerythrobacter jejuensis TaxID=795812 RepID=A0A845AU96_9SPHN|nr:NADPH:quinone oxidoreductase family protein [Parerythrobacter jejuensis]MXP32625.1 zinc-binding dehydrogenase [Parerythrobacter jejuensis]
MQALRVETLSDDFSGVLLTDLPRPERGPGEVLVRIQAASLNYPDLLMTQGKYQFKPEPPFTSGMELAGEVIAADHDGPFATGDRVMGGAKTGGFAEFASVPARSLRKVPEGISFPAAAAMGAAYSTAYTGLFELGGLEAGQWVLVHGASGGVGLAACDLAKALGAKVIAATHREDKIERLQAASGADAVILNHGRFRERVSELTDGKLCDLVFDTVGGDIFDESTRCVAFGGKLLVVGFVAGRIPEISVNIPLIKGFSVVGVRAGEYARRFPDRGARIMGEIHKLAVSGAITPYVDATLPLAQWRDAFAAMQRGDLIGKIILQP